MTLNRQKVQRYLKEFDFESLFIEELFWDPVDINIPPIVVGDDEYNLMAIAQKRGLTIYALDSVPPQFIRQKIDIEVTQYTYEHLIIYGHSSSGQQVWQWVKREGEKRTTPKETHFNIRQSGELLIQKLEKIAVSLEEEEKINLPEMTQRVKQGFDIDKVTKEFFSKFQDKHLQLVSFIEGIENSKDAAWYASVILNRLMFIYFLQKKGFLDDGNTDYLQDKLDESQQRGQDLYYTEFLQALFFQGFGQPEDLRKDDIIRLIGNIKYLNGGLFLPHSLELKYGDKIKIADQGFREIFNLFASYTWHLDDRPSGKDDEINPDVLGYIFEKYINQKEFGAYYTRPEITEYLCQRTIDKFILEKILAFSPLPSTNKQDACTTLGDINLDNNLCNLLLDNILPQLSILDPACGSAAFLVAALKHLMGIYTTIFDYIKESGDPHNKTRLQHILNHHPSLEYYIKKRVITDNLYGIDIMEEATEIAKLRLFLSLVASAKTVEDLEPLPNIDFNIMAGNSLIGLIRVDGNAFDSISSKNKSSSGGKGKKKKETIQGSLLPQIAATEYQRILAEKNESIRKYKEHAFVLSEIEGTPQTDRLQRLRENIERVNRESTVKLNQLLLDEFSTQLGIKYEEVQLKGKSKKRLLTLEDMEVLKPFHWGYHFDEIITRGGFDIIITNPPWEIFKPQAKEFFANYSELVTKNKMDIKTFEKQQKQLLESSEVAKAWLEYQSQYPHLSLYYRSAEQYVNQISVVNGKKQGTDINLYKLFLEQAFNLLHSHGRCGIIIPTGIYTDLGCKQLREMLFSQTELGKLFSLSNERFIFEGVDHRFKFCLLDFEKGSQTDSFKAIFRIDPREAIRKEDLGQFLQDESELVRINVDLIRQLSPDSISVMEFKTDLDIQIAKKMSQFPLLGEQLEDKWNLKLTREFDMTNDSHLFKTEPAKGRLPLYEGKMIHQFTHQYAEPRYWIDETEGRQAVLGKKGVDHGQILDYQCYRLGIRSIGRNTDIRTLIAGNIPKNVFCGNSILVLSDTEKISSLQVIYLQGIMNSFMVDFALRQKVSANVNMFYIYQLPVPRLTEKDPYFNEIVERAAKLICTTPEYDDLAKEVGITPSVIGGKIQYGVTDETERAKIRAELDGMIAHLYGLSEAEFSHILSTFPIVPEQVKQDALNAYRVGT